MENLFAKLLFGHLAGDYLLQSKKMALQKSEKLPRGLMVCILHCLIYSACICVFTWTFRLDILLLVFLTHFPIDRWSLADKWLNLIKGRSILGAYNSKKLYHEIDLIFSCIVYTVVDNTLHLILMFWVYVNFL